MKELSSELWFSVRKRGQLGCAQGEGPVTIRPQRAADGEGLPRGLEPLGNQEGPPGHGRGRAKGVGASALSVPSSVRSAQPESHVESRLLPLP